MATTTTGIVEGELVLYPEKSSLERLRYFFGQLLTQRDLEVEQSYHLRLQRLTQREAFGTGTVAGLGVTPATGVSDLSVFVNPGLAFDPDGRELILEAMECIPVAEVSVPPTAGTISGGDETAVAMSVAGVFGPPFTVLDLNELQDALRACGLLASDSSLADLVTRLNLVPEPSPPGSLVLDAPILLRDYLFDQLVGVTFVGLRYREVGSDPAPAVLDASCCGGVSCFPTRTSQGVYIVSSNDSFAEIEDPYTAIRECIDTQFFEQMAGDNPVDVRATLCACLTAPGAWRGLPPTDDACGPPALPIVPLAKVCWRRFDDDLLPNILSVDNCSWRPLAPGIPAIRSLIESFASGARAGALLPRIVEISPTENEAFSEGSIGSGFTITARLDAEVTADPDAAGVWELYYYPESGSALKYNSLTPSGPGTGGNTISAALLDPGSGSGRVFQLSLTGGSALPAGTYVWRVQIGGTKLEATPTNSAQLDGEPNPPMAVPSGNGFAGGTFEARFVVTSGS